MSFPRESVTLGYRESPALPPKDGGRTGHPDWIVRWPATRHPVEFPLAELEHRALHPLLQRQVALKRSDCVLDLNRRACECCSVFVE